TADTGRAQAVPRTASPQLMDQIDRDPCARRGKRMRDRDRTAVHIRLLMVEAELTGNRRELRCERLIHVDKVHVIQCQTRLLQCLSTRRRRADPHDARIDARDAPRHEAADRLETVALRPGPAGHDTYCRAVADATRVAGSDETILPE